MRSARGEVHGALDLPPFAVEEDRASEHPKKKGGAKYLTPSLRLAGRGWFGKNPRARFVVSNFHVDFHGTV